MEDQRRCRICKKFKDEKEYYGKTWKLCKPCVKDVGLLRRMKTRCATKGLIIESHMSGAEWQNILQGIIKDLESKDMTSPFIEDGRMVWKAKCRKCGTRKNIFTEFHASSTTHTGYETMCKKCRFGEPGSR